MLVHSINILIYSNNREWNLCCYAISGRNTLDTLHGTTHDGRELMRSNSERDRHMTNHHHASTMSHRKAYRDPHDYHNASNGSKGKHFLFVCGMASFYRVCLFNILKTNMFIADEFFRCRL